MIGIRQQRQLAAHRAGHRGLQRRRSRSGWPSCSTSYRFAAVLDCAGNCALKSCELDPAMAWRINVEGVRNLLAMVAERDARLVHLSIDLVFSGTRRAAVTSKHDPTDPVTVYGKTMVAAEQLISADCAAACILRISLPMGVSFNGHAGAIDWIQSRFKKSKPATLYFDEVRTPTYTDCLNRAVRDACWPATWRACITPAARGG